MKWLLLVILVSFNTIIVSTALAWSPLDVFESAAETTRHCYSVTAGSEQKQEEQNDNNDEEEEEEPDCD